MTRFSTRPALTKIELIVVVVLALSFAGIALSFLIGGREASRRVTCANNLHYIGKAIHAYGDRHKVLDAAGASHRALPPACIGDGYATWAVLLQPFLQPKTASPWDVQKTYFDQPEAARTHLMSILFCPARVRPGTLSISGDGAAKGEHLPGALGDYATAAGNGQAANGPILVAEVLEKKDGVILRWRSQTHFDSLKRGTSVTILMGDKHVQAGNFGKAESGDGSTYNGARPESFQRVAGPGFPLARSPTEPLNNNFGGSHPGFCNFLMADTSVRNIANDIKLEVLGQMMTRE